MTKSGNFSKLPIRQITRHSCFRFFFYISKLPIRQITKNAVTVLQAGFSKLPIRQITVKNKKILRYCLAVSFFLYFIPNLSSFANI
nr:MAG TPA: hypothetical protein [Caudoviricetes sp.]